MKPQKIPHRTEPSPSARPTKLLHSLPRALGWQLKDTGLALRKAQGRAQIPNPLHEAEQMLWAVTSALAWLLPGLCSPSCCGARCPRLCTPGSCCSCTRQRGNTRIFLKAPFCLGIPQPHTRHISTFSPLLDTKVK